VKEVEANCLLDFHSGAFCVLQVYVLDPYITPKPEIIQVLLLRCQELFEPEVHCTVQGPFSATAKFFDLRRPSRMVSHVFGEMNRTASLGLGRKDNLPEVVAMHDVLAITA
jgi:hypothetical protein